MVRGGRANMLVPAGGLLAGVGSGNWQALKSDHGRLLGKCVIANRWRASGRSGDVGRSFAGCVLWG